MTKHGQWSNVGGFEDVRVAADEVFWGERDVDGEDLLSISQNCTLC
jgi:hypothetical protein